MSKESMFEVVPKLAVLASLALLIACSSPPPETSYYLMRGEVSASSGRVDGSIRVGLGRLIVAPYLLASDGIVVETARGEVRAAGRHRWAEPLDAGLRWFLREEITLALGDDVGAGRIDRKDWDYTIDVYIARFHGTMSGTALLDGTFVLRPTDVSLASREYRFSREEKLAGEGYAALVATQQDLARALAVEIADGVAEMIALGDSTAP
jgi:uncharacterized lipoprotein YmbA